MKQHAEVAAIEAETAVKAAKLATEAAASIPKLPPPDPRQAPFFDALVSAERSALARILPRRNRWPELKALEERVTAIDQQQTTTAAELSALHERKRQAEQLHPAELAEWIAGGQHGPRPQSQVAALAQQIEELQANLKALELVREQILQERVEYVSKHRRRLVRDAEQATKDARARYLQLVDEAEQAREDVIACRETTVWAELYPHAALQSQPDRSLVGAHRPARLHWVDGELVDGSHPARASRAGLP